MNDAPGTSCPTCGTGAPSGRRFCTTCGAALTAGPPAPPPFPAPTPTPTRATPPSSPPMTPPPDPPSGSFPSGPPPGGFPGGPSSGRVPSGLPSGRFPGGPALSTPFPAATRSATPFPTAVAPPPSRPTGEWPAFAPSPQRRTLQEATPARAGSTTASGGFGGGAIVAAIVAVAAIVVVIVVGMSRSGATSASVASGTAGTAAGSAASSAVSAAAAPTSELPADPTAQLQALAAQDSSTVEGMVGSWIPQLSSKRPGLVADGKTWDAADIVGEYQSLQATYPGARLLWTGDFANYQGRNFWATVAAQPMPTAAAANAWCDTQGLDADHCYAVRLTHTGGPVGNSVQRPHR